MSHQRLNRRTFVTAAGTVSALTIAGCASGPGGNETENETNDTDAGTDDTYTLTVVVENGQGPVEGATVTLEEAGASGMGGDTGMGNESGNMTGNESANATTTDGMGGENESTNDTMGDDGEMGNESGNMTGNESGNGTATDDDTAVGTQSFPIEKETGTSGEAEFEGLTDGEYTVIAENEGQQTEDTAEIDGSDEEITLTLGDGGNETGNQSTNETASAGTETGA